MSLRRFCGIHVILRLLSFTVPLLSINCSFPDVDSRAFAVPVAGPVAKLPLRSPASRKGNARTKRRGPATSGVFPYFPGICQQPSTWLRTGELMQSHAAELRDLVDGISRLSLSGSGSSEYAGDCV